MAKTAVVRALLALLAICIGVESVFGFEMGGYAAPGTVDDDNHDTRTRPRDVYVVRDYSSDLRYRGRYYDHNTHTKSSETRREPDSSSDCDTKSGFPIAFFGFVAVVILTSIISTVLAKDSVILIQVAFEGVADQIEQDLDAISIISDTRTEGGLHLLLSKTVSRVYRYPENCLYAYANVNTKRNGGGMKCFNQTYLEERGKVNPLIKKATCPNRRFAIVTILVAASGHYELPVVNCHSDLDRALCTLTSIDSRSIRAVKVLWTARDDIEDFPTLKRLLTKEKNL